MRLKSRKEFLKEAIRYGSSLLLFTFVAETIGAEGKASSKKQKNKSKDSESSPKEKSPEPTPLPEGESPVSESDTTAKALGFHHDANQTDFTTYPFRKNLSAKNQICQSCIQYTASNDSWGKCNILSNGVVSAKGWCSAWSGKIR